MSGDDEKTECVIDNLNSNEKEKELLLAYSDSSSATSSRSSSPEPESEPTDPKFAQPPVSRIKRTSLLIFLALLLWLAYSLRTNVLNAKKKAKIIYASRYSKDYKFRPAASPIVTETLKDGRIRLRGALPEPTAPPPASAVVKKKRRPVTGKVSGKKSSGTKSKPNAANRQRM